MANLWTPEWLTQHLAGSRDPVPAAPAKARRPVVCKAPVTTELLLEAGRVVGIRFPLVTLNESNERSLRGRAFALSSYRKGVHRAVATALLLVPRPALPCVVTMTRLSAGTLDDDGLRSALKAVRDAIALWVGMDDADPRVRWDYEQGKCARGTMGLELRVGGVR